MNATLHVGFTGTRLGMSGPQFPRVFSTMHGLNRVINLAHHGCCVGADSEFHQICWDLPIPVPIKGHPPINPRYHNKALKGYQHLALPDKYLPRDRAIVKESEFLIATPNTFTPTQGSGTWYTVRYAIRRNIPVMLVRPDGSAEFIDRKKRSFPEYLSEVLDAA